MKVEIEVALAIERALIQSEELFERLDRAKKTAAQISVAATNIRLPNVTGGGTSSGGISSSTNAMNALAAAIARQRASAATASQATAALNSTISAATAAANAAAGATQALAVAQARQAAAAGQANTNTATQAAANAGLLSSIIQLAAGYVTLRAAWGFTADSVNQSIAVENLTNTLTATSGSAKQAASDLAFLRSEAQRIGINFLASSEGFVKFNVAVQGAGLSGQFARDTFTALSEASRRLGLNTGQQASVFLALEQMLSKGTVSAQELRLQLGNALPGAFQTAARAMGITTVELHKLVETGNLASSDFLPKFINQLQKELPATAETLASTSAEINRLGNAWQKFRAELGKSLPVKEAAKIAANVITELTPITDPADKEAYKKQNERINAYLKSIDPMLGQESLGRSGLPTRDELLATFQRQDARRLQLNNKRSANINRISNDDTATAADLDRASKFWKLYRQLESDTLTEEQNKRADIMRRYEEAIAKIRDNKDALTKPMVEALVAEAQKAQANQLQQFDDKEALDRSKQLADNAKASREELETINSLRVKLIPDEEAQKIARVNQEFDELRNKLLLFELGNPSSISGDWEKQLEAARTKALAGVRTQKSPTGFLNTDFGQLQSERQGLIKSLATDTDVDSFRDKTQRIQEISQAMSVKLKADAVSWSDSFKFGISEMQESWGSSAERMANVGQSLADSLQRNISGALSDIALSTKEPKEAFADMSRAIVQELVKIAIQELIVKQLLSSAGSMFGGAGVAGHSGIVVGREGMATQFAPRYHSGSGPVGDEQLIMARRGEVVFTPEQMKMLGGSSKGGQPIQVITLFDRKVFDQMRAANPSAVVNEIGANKQMVRQILQS